MKIELLILYFFDFVGFDNASLSTSVQEGSSPNSVTLKVIRRFGLRGGSRVHWEARLNGVLASDDITPVQGDLVFAQGESSHDIVFSVIPDDIPEVLEVRNNFISTGHVSCFWLLDRGQTSQIRAQLIKNIITFLSPNVVFIESSMLWPN